MYTPIEPNWDSSLLDAMSPFEREYYVRGMRWMQFQQLLGQPCLDCLIQDSMVFKSLRARVLPGECNKCRQTAVVNVDGLCSSCYEKSVHMRATSCKLCGVDMPIGLVSNKAFEAQICRHCDKA